MQTIYLLSGINKEVGFEGRVIEYLQKDIKSSCTICFIASSFANPEKNDMFKSNLTRWFNNIDISFKNIYLIDNRITKEESHQYINKSDVVFLMGGDPEKEMQSIEEYELVDLLKNKDGVIIGVSAGSMNMAEEVYYMDEEEHKNLIQYKGIGLTDINIYPHFDFDNTEILKETVKVSKYKKLIALPNESFIKIHNDKIEYIGDYYIYHNGVQI